MKIPDYAKYGLYALGVYGAYILIKARKNNKAEINTALNKWMDTLCNPNSTSEDVASLYAKDGVLLGTVAERVYKGPGDIKLYFDEFLQANPCGEFDKIIIQDYGMGAVADGLYTFTLNPDTDEEQIVKARFTYVFKEENGIWKISTHHSSVDPGFEEPE